MKSTSFQRSLAEGRQREIACADWLQRKYGAVVLPAYDYSGLGNDKAPKLLGIDRAFVVPDLLVAVDGKTWWVECKWKSRATQDRKTGRRFTGISRRLYTHYGRVQELTGIPVCVYFLHGREREIRGQGLSWLQTHIVYDYTGPKMGPDGMVFWDFDELQLFGSLDELRLNEGGASHGAA